LLHSLAKTHPSFDDPNLVSHAGLVPVMALAQRAGLGDLAAQHVRPGGACGASAAVKVPCLVAGMAAGADSIDDMDLLRHGAMGVLFGGIRAPSTLGSHLRCYTWGNVSQLEKAGRPARGFGRPPGVRPACALSAPRARPGIVDGKIFAGQRENVPRMDPLPSRLPTAATQALKYLLGVRSHHDRNRTRADPKPTFISDGAC
jgi:hypothetical protein